MRPNHSFFAKQDLFGIGRRVDAQCTDPCLLPRIAWDKVFASLKLVDTDVVGDSENPTAQIIFSTARVKVAVESEERVLNDLFGLHGTHIQA